MSEPWAELILGDCLEMMSEIEDNSVDSIVCDPPYGLSKEPDMAEVLRHWLAGDDYKHKGKGFMGKSWDSFVPGPAVWRECLRVLKPGGHLVAFFGTRTYDIGTLAIRLAGFEIRDQLAWVYGSGFPKSLDVSKAIDKAAGAEREVVGVGTSGKTAGMQALGPSGIKGGEFNITSPATEAAREWQGWGTALKPAWEPICLARKPLIGTVAVNVLGHGTGALNIYGCRVAIAAGSEKDKRVGTDYVLGEKRGITSKGHWGGASNEGLQLYKPEGRWPANFVHDGSDEVVGLFPDSGGSAARFFYCAKASKSDRNEGLDSYELVTIVAAWENADLEVRLWVDTAPSPPRVIAVYDAPSKNVSEWNTFLFGRAQTGLFPQDSRFTIKTATNSTIESPTLRWLIRSLTNVSTAAVNYEAESGGNLAESAEHSTRSVTITSDQMGYLPGAVRVPSKTPLQISASVGRSTHPTVKPTALMRWLVRMVTPLGGVALDPFMGSGSTGKACMIEGFNFIGIEMDEGYMDIAEGRIAAAKRARTE